MLTLAFGAGGAWYAQPWGRTLDRPGLDALIARGAVDRIWVTDGGLEGGVIVAPGALVSSVPVLADYRTPFFASLGEGDIPRTIRELRARGVEVDASWEVRRLTDLAVEAQRRSRYYGLAGGDVRTYAQRLAELEPGSEVAASLFLKVGERMAWDADAARAEGAPERAAEILAECLELVPEHPRCLASVDPG